MQIRPWHPALGLALAAGAAAAVPLATVTGRESVTYVTYTGGFAIAGDSGTDGSLTPVSALDPPVLALDGSHTYNGAYLGWTVTYTVDWNVAQSFAVDAAAHAITGQGSIHLDESSAVVGPNCAPCAATVSISGTDAQTLTLTLSDSAAYQFHSTSTPGQFSELDIFDVASQRWFGLWSGPIENQGVTFDRSGTLQPGLYRVRNNTGYLTADSSPPAWDAAWSYTLTLPDAQVTSVPEPAATALWAIGLAAIGWRWRRRPIRPQDRARPTPPHRRASAPVRRQR